MVAGCSRPAVDRSPSSNPPSPADPAQPRHLIGRRVELVGSGSAPVLRAVLADADAAAQAVISFWGVGQLWHGTGRAVVRAASSTREFTAWGGDAHTATIAATTRQDRVVVMSPALVASAADARRFVLTHELTHARLGVESKAPRWVAEGAAELTAWRSSGLSFADYAPALAAQVRAGRAPQGPPDDNELSSNSSADTLQLSYQQACAFSEFLLLRVGAADFRAYVTAALAGDDTFESRFGGTPSDLIEPFQTRLRTLFGAAASD